MKLKTLKPLYLGGKTLVEGTSFLTGEQHGRQLVQKGYAVEDDSKDDAVVDLADSESQPNPLTTTGPSSQSKRKKQAD
ncbi:hypothetical protein [Pseudomonas viridiflava]|uniref:hypothetical protein n=1 Tax=Pseudomonas viridiflava TaxID=33069 RepID=UPI0005B6A27F|nr:hypothetical protein [Pseudomonas viridiflava]KIQ36449.1 hypothetical protein RT94_05370 [Pseudomonas viridiflava]MBV1812519.1 hypothetical protein [Pseudomonas viridiflava]